MALTTYDGKMAVFDPTEPLCEVRLYKGVPLDSDYVNTVYQNSIAQFLEDLTNYLVVSVTKYTYERTSLNVIRLEGSVSDYCNCNYIAFRNDMDGILQNQKWYFGFVDRVEYVNHNVVAVYFTIDYMQTWWQDFTLLPCYVTRMHEANEVYGQNIVPEPVQLGEYTVLNDSDGDPLSAQIPVWLSQTDYKYLRECYIVVLEAREQDDSVQLLNGCVSGYRAFAYDWHDSSDRTDLKAKLDSHVQDPSAIIAIYLCPKAFIIVGSSHLINDASFGGHIGGSTSNTFDYTMKFGSYTPANPKLYTYPYCFIRVDNSTGSDLILRPELFDENSYDTGVEWQFTVYPAYTLSASVVLPVEVSLMPMNYKGHGGIDGTQCTTERLCISGFPQGSWSYGAWEQWVAQQAVPSVLNIVSAAIPTVAIGGNIAGQIGDSNIVNIVDGKVKNIHNDLESTTTGYQIQAGASTASAVNAITGTISSMYTASISASTVVGAVGGNNSMFSGGMLEFNESFMGVNEQEAIRIDRFFTMYGYAQNKLQQPYRLTRTYWTYLQTNGCQVSGNIPADAKRTIQAILDKGVTFWNENYGLANIGNYDFTRYANPWLDTPLV